MNRKEFIFEVVRNWNVVSAVNRYGSTDYEAVEFVKGNYRCGIKDERNYDGNNVVHFYSISIGKLDDNAHFLVDFTIKFSDFTDTELSEIKFLLSLKSNNAVDNAIKDAINQ